MLKMWRKCEDQWKTWCINSSKTLKVWHLIDFVQKKLIFSKKWQEYVGTWYAYIGLGLLQKTDSLYSGIKPSFSAHLLGLLR